MRADYAGWGMVAAGLVFFLALATQVRPASRGSAIGQLDQRIARAALRHSGEHPRFLQFAVDITDAGGVPVMTALAIVGPLLLWICGHVKLARIWILTAALGAVIDLEAKDLIGRERPGESLRDPAVSERNASFPSGHAMGSTIGYGMLGYVGFVLLRKRVAKVMLLAALAVWVAVICWSRVYLRAHWFSDVLGGVALGAAWLALVIAISQLTKNHHKKETSCHS